MHFYRGWSTIGRVNERSISGDICSSWQRNYIQLHRFNTSYNHTKCSSNFLILFKNVEEVFTKLLRAIDPISFDQQYNTRNQIVFQTTQQQQQQKQQHPQLQSDHSEGIRQPAAQEKKSWWWNRISWLPFGTTKQASKQAC